MNDKTKKKIKGYLLRTPMYIFFAICCAVLLWLGCNTPEISEYLVVLTVVILIFVLSCLLVYMYEKGAKLLKAAK